MSRVTYNIIHRAVDSWNEAHPDLILTSYASEGNCTIGVLGAHGSIKDVLISAGTCREALEMFNYWKCGYQYGKSGK